MSARCNARRVLVALALIASACGTTPSVAPSAIETATPMATAPPPAFDGHTWFLDFKQSGLSDRVAGCPCTLGSSLSFNNGSVSGGTGAGGGCDGFSGTYLVAGRMLHISVTPPSANACYPGRVRQIHAGLVRVASWVLTGCASGICNDLTLMDTIGNTLLVYRLGEQSDS
jgi:hypothetical protein